MLTTGIVVGMLAFSSIAITYSYLPPMIQLFLLRYPLLADVIAMALIWSIIMMVTGTLVAFISGFVVEICLFLTFKFGKKYLVSAAKKKIKS